MKSVASFLNLKSAKLTSTRTITGVAFFVALFVALRFFNIHLSATLKISFTFLATVLCARLYGFWPTMIYALAADFTGFMMSPDGIYNPLFALVLMVKGAIYVAFFYQVENISIPRFMLAQFLASLIGNVLLNPLLLTMMFDMPYWALVSTRVVKNIVCFPIECIVIYFAFRFLPKTLFQVKPQMN